MERNNSSTDTLANDDDNYLNKNLTGDIDYANELNTQELQLNNIKNKRRNKREYFETVRNNFVQEEDESNLEESELERTFVNPVCEYVAKDKKGSKVS